MTSSWKRGPYSLQFSLGELSLLRFRLQAVWLDAPFYELSPDLLEDLPDFSKLPPEVEAAVIPWKPIEGKVAAITLMPGWIRYVFAAQERYYVALEGDFQTYLGKFSARSRGNLRRVLRKFREFSGGEVCWKEFRAPEEIPVFHELATAVARRAWQGQFGGSLSESMSTRQKLVKLAGEGRVRGYVLFHGSRPLAFAYCEAGGRTLGYEIPAFDPDFAGFAPGKVLLLLILESLFEKKEFAALDFKETYVEYKKFFANRSPRCAVFLYFRRSWRHLGLVFVHLLVARFSHVTGQVLRWLRLKAVVTRGIRFLRALQHRSQQKIRRAGSP